MPEICSGVARGAATGDPEAITTRSGSGEGIRVGELVEVHIHLLQLVVLDPELGHNRLRRRGDGPIDGLGHLTAHAAGSRNGDPAHQTGHVSGQLLHDGASLDVEQVLGAPTVVAEVRVRAAALEGGPQLIEQGGGEGVILAATGRVQAAQLEQRGELLQIGGHPFARPQGGQPGQIGCRPGRARPGRAGLRPPADRTR